ncbi:MAG TPA: hypothetical protein DEA96_02125 [Leptospiraceae bacterium]|nr:hypothetical protein [Spirochaetaceae bacterium]HBS03732.1 hypothetical protein [Leptospiraceae bacterium]|tara:strand:+ start:276027 stop:276278 length:252 start_codon:yes stop_codon:yes gene_type:complete
MSEEMDQETLIRSMDSQLITLYGEKELLLNEVGVCDAAELISLIKSMEAQLADLYADRENAIIIDGNRITISGPKKIFVRKSK